MLKHTDPTKDPDWKSIKLAVKADKMRMPRGKGKDLKEHWYEKPKTFKHCFLFGCEAKRSRFKGTFR